MEKKKGTEKFNIKGVTNLKVYLKMMKQMKEKDIYIMRMAIYIMVN